MIRIYAYPTARGWKAEAPELGIGARDYDKHEAVRQCRREVESCTDELTEVVDEAPPAREELTD